MTVHAKEIITGKFWILENEGEKIATISLDENNYILSDKNGSRFYQDEKSIETEIGTIEWKKLSIKEIPIREVHGFACNTTPFNLLYDVKRKLPLFTKSIKSKSLYCAGYYIIKFNKGWVKSFCPKLITLERYNYQGPYKTNFEMKNALRIANES